MGPVKREASSSVSEGGGGSGGTKKRKLLFTPSAPKQESQGGDDLPAKEKEEEEEEEEEQVVPSSFGTQRYALRLRDRPARVATSSATDSTKATTTTSPKKSKSEEVVPSSPQKNKDSTNKSFFEISPRKTNKPIKRDLEAHEAHPAPARWQETYSLLLEQRRRIVAPVDTMGSQTKDPVTAAAVTNLQRQLPGGLSIDSLIAASDDEVSSAINKVGFWRRKTGYIKSAARILKADFNGDVPRDVDDICSLPGVGPKMAYLLLQSAWNINEGIGVDVHVHRISNRLGWHNPPTKEAEQTRLNLQSWLPKVLHTEINRVLVGFGQVVCLPVSPRCDLCILSPAKLCPSRRKVDPKSIESRVKVEFLPQDAEGNAIESFPHKFRYVVDYEDLGAGSSKVKKEEGGVLLAAKVEVEGPEGVGVLLADSTEASNVLTDAADGAAEVKGPSGSSSGSTLTKTESQADPLEW
ncbi:unnamed protein product [Tilletia laevis]|nr:unnamed protein product [Tilletia caries]CAD6933206.1 unnamed protein product [Tilletia laevis]CAD6979311.1 unnamed protein product [Tilletia controversa]